MALKFLIIPGSLRAGSHNARLAALVARELALANAEVTLISLSDYALPIYDAHVEARGMPEAALNLKRQFMAHQGIFIASPEYNASINPLTKNTIDWVSRVRERGEPVYAGFRNRVFALGSAAPGRFGGVRGLMALRQSLELGVNAQVLPQQICVPFADKAFDDNDLLKEERDMENLRSAIRSFIDAAERAA